MTTSRATQAVPADAPKAVASVVIVGAGPVGLTLALELDRFGVDVVVVERNATSTQHPKMDITNGRSMELYRRLGVADTLRKLAIPDDRPMKVTWVTDAAGWELAAFEYPGVAEQERIIRDRNDGTLPLEPSMRISQVVLEPALREELEARGVPVHYGWSFDRFIQDQDGVTVTVTHTATGTPHTVRAQYLVGCDGAGSRVRGQLGIGLDEVDMRGMFAKELGLGRMVKSVIRNFRVAGQRPMDGRFYLVHFRTHDPSALARFGPAWHLQSPEGWVLISQNDHDIFTLHVPLGIGTDVDKLDPREVVQRCLGLRFAMVVLVANHWTPRLTVADSYGRGRVWLAGDAVHQVPPTGGYGMNTGVGDAVGIGWALAAQVHGWGGPKLLTAYECERRAVALRNRTAAARHAAVRGAIMTSDWSAMRSERWDGAATRRRLGREILDLGNLENEALGIEIGYSYHDSPTVCRDTGDLDPQRMEEYRPTSRPGARPPSLYLDDGRAIFDLFGTWFTLLRFGDHDVAPLVDAAAQRGVPLEVVDIREDRARRLYQKDLVLLRPDQHVAWRGDTAPSDPLAVIDTVRGALPRRPEGSRR